MLEYLQLVFAISRRYLDVVFKMLEYAPESVNEDVWHRVVQVVSGTSEDEDGPGQAVSNEKLQK